MTVTQDKYNEDKCITRCDPCHTFLAGTSDNKTRHSWKNVWPSFYWNLLIGKDEASEYLWRFLQTLAN